jgi:hypothetical protein
MVHFCLPAGVPVFTRDAYFWATQAGAELDLLVLHQGRRLGYEFKFPDAPGTTKSMHVAVADLKLDRLWVIHSGSRRYPLGEKIEAIGLAEATVELTRES